MAFRERKSGLLHQEIQNLGILLILVVFLLVICNPTFHFFNVLALNHIVGQHSEQHGIQLCILECGYSQFVTCWRN